MSEDKMKHDCDCGDDCGCEDEHVHGDDCGCGDHGSMQMMKLELEDGTEVEWEVVLVFDVDDKEYIALAPEESEEVYLYGYSEDEEGVVLGSIEDDEEFEKVGEAFDKILEEELGSEE